MESQNLSVVYIRQQPRWDFRYFEPKYLEAERIIKTSIYPVEPLEKYVDSIANFGAYSLCNLLEWVDEGVPYIRVTDLKEDGISWNTVPHIPPHVHEQLPKSKVFPGDVMYSMAGTIGLAVVAPANLGECNSNQAIAKIRLRSDELNPYYLAAFLNSRLGRFQSERIANGQTVLNINLGEIGTLIVPVPSPSVQNDIAVVMQDAYKLRMRKRSEAKALLHDIDDYVLNVLGISNVLPKDERSYLVRRSRLQRADVRYFSPVYDGLEEMIASGQYPTDALGNVCIKLDNGLTPARTDYTDEGVAIIKVASITKDWRIAWEKVAFTTEPVFIKAEKAHVRNGDFLLLSASHQLNYIGRNFAIVRNMPDEYEGRCMAVGELIIARVNTDTILPEFLLACFTTKHIQELTNRLSRGQSAHLYANDLKGLRIPVPPINIQQKIVDELEQRRLRVRQILIEGNIAVTRAKEKVEQMTLGK